MKKIINLTPHDINIVDSNLNVINTFKSEGIARVSANSVLKGYIKDINIYSTQYGEVTGLPDQQEGTYYIVSMLVKQALPNRTDLFSPSQLQRDSKGQPIGCLGLE